MVEQKMDSENWGAEPWRKPTLEPDDTELFSEYGRVLRRENDRNATDYRSHWFVLVKPQFDCLTLLVRHGGGQERIRLGYCQEHLVDSLELLPSEHRYLMLHLLYDVNKDATRSTRESTAMKYQRAFLDGKLKRKRRNNMVYAEIIA